jgi:hypothetical protein
MILALGSPFALREDAALGLFAVFLDWPDSSEYLGVTGGVPSGWQGSALRNA